MPLQIIHRDITTMDCDAIVNPTDNCFSGSGGTDYAIHTAAGLGLRYECDRLEPLSFGEVAVTGGYKLPCRYIIHTMGPVWTGGQRCESVLLRSCYILDKSGSMAGLESDTIGGFNAMIEKQKKLDGKCYVSTVLFSNRAEVIHDRVDINEVKPLTEKEYSTYGCTALLDALGGAIHHIGNVHKYARPEDVPEHTIFVITTDGMENASRAYSDREVKQMIKKEEEKYGWEFLFLAANIDAVETAERYGIRRERAANYNATKEGTDAMYACMSMAVESIRSADDLDESWADVLNK